MSERKIKTFDELTITDDFMFGAVMSDPDNMKPLLEYILGIKIEKITYPERQKVIDVTYDAKGVRLDVYCEDNQHTVYSVEVQVADAKNLPKRIRYYHSMIDLNTIDRGEDYRKLKRSYVIFICCFDPFDKGRYMYTFENQCQEIPELYLNDGSHSILLNVNGTIGEISSELKAALQYMAGKTPLDGYAKNLDDAVKRVKKNEKWRRDYMTFAMKMKESNEITDLARVISTIRNSRGIIDNDTLIQILKMDKKQFERIISMVEEHPEMDDWGIAEAIAEF